MRFKSGLASGIFCVILFTSGCVPIPVSSVPLHPRETRPVAVESTQSEGNGSFSIPAFDASGALLAAYDAGSDQVRILRSSDLTARDSLKPTRRPRRLSFSPGGQFLLIEAQQGWVEDFLRKGKLPHAADIDSADAIRDDIQRVEIWNLRSGQRIPDLQCDAVSTSEPEGGWLWAKRKAITPGYRSSAVLEAHFSSDEHVLSMLCWNGVRQRWDSRTWQRLEDQPPPPFWDALMRFSNARWQAGNDVASRSADGHIAALRIREQSIGFPMLYLWDADVSQARRLPGDCATRLMPVYALSSDGNRIVVVCNQGLGHAFRAWDLASARELPLRDAEFGLSSGTPLIRGEGVAMSPNGRYLAVALLNQVEALLVVPLPAPMTLSRSDLRIWDIESGHEQVSLALDDQTFYADFFRGIDVAFSPDSTILAVGGRRLRLYHVSDLLAR